MKPRSLRLELTRASLITTLVALLLMAGSLFLYELVSYRQTLANDARTQADLIANATSTAIIFDDRKVAQENLALLRLKPSVRAAAIHTASGAIFASYTRPSLGQRPPLARDTTLETQGLRFEGRVLDVAHPIHSEGELLGFVYLQFDDALREQARDYGIILGIVALLSLTLSFLVFDRLQRRVTGPLLAMRRVAEEVMNKRNWALRAPPTGNLDMAVLVRAFNDMLSEVQARTGELEQSNAELGRTNELLERETRERRSAEEELKRMDKRKDEFLATLAHELRNPLAPMMNAAALMRSRGADAGIRDRASLIMERQLRHMARLIDDLLDVSRVVTGKLSLHAEVVDLAEVVNQAVELAGPMVQQRHQQLDCQLLARPCWIVGDPARLSQVFSNLLNNASRYTPEQGRIDVTVLTRESVAVVQVRDNGMGVEPSMLQRIFELFEQADKSLERGSAGLGIGLTLARQIAELHGGSVSAHSDGLGKGSCFTVRLPMVPASAESTSDRREPALPAPVALQILIADDNADHASSLGLILQSLGHTVKVVHDGLAAAEAILASPPDVALLDIGMPKLNGYDLARRLRRELGHTGLRMIAVTGWGDAADREKATAAGFDAHLVKPVRVDVLLAAISDRPIGDARVAP